MGFFADNFTECPEEPEENCNYSSTHAVLVVDGFVDNETPKQEIKPSK